MADILQKDIVFYIFARTDDLASREEPLSSLCLWFSARQSTAYIYRYPLPLA